jgi:hypothetical protein
MSSSPTYIVVDQFDGDEFPDPPEAPAALLAALTDGARSPQTSGTAALTAGDPGDRGVRGRRRCPLVRGRSPAGSRITSGPRGPYR